jgi:hypothetical protein
MLSRFFTALSEDARPAAMAVLVEGGVVELSTSHMAEAGFDDLLYAPAWFNRFLDDPLARERLSGAQVVDQMMTWFVKVLPQVGTVVGQ